MSRHPQTTVSQSKNMNNQCVRSSCQSSTPNIITTKHRRQSESSLGPDLPSPPSSAPRADRPPKRRKTYQDKNYLEPCEQVSEGVERDVDPLRPPKFWNNLSRIPLVRGALKEHDRRNRRIAAAPKLTHSIPIKCDLIRYARHGGPDLSDLRGFGEEVEEVDEDENGDEREGKDQMPRGRRARGGSSGTSRGGVHKRRSSRGRSTSSDQRTKSSSPYDPAFKQHLTDHRVWPMHYWYEDGEQPPPPDNLQEIIAHIHGAPRASLEPDSFTAEDFQRFKKAYHLTSSEEPRSRTLELVEGVLSISTTQVKRGPFQLSQLHPLTPDQIVPGNPDRAYGSRPEKLDRAARHDPEIQDLILPNPAQDILCPNFIVHVKGPGGSQEVADVQAVYDGALAARGMEALWAYGSEGDERDQPNDARTLTCTFASGALRMYAVHIRPCGSSANRVQRQQTSSRNTQDGIEYITTRVGAWFIDTSLDELRQAASAFRNGLDWAQEQRDRAIDRVNRRLARRQGVQESSVDGSSSRPSTSSSVDPIA